MKNICLVIDYTWIIACFSYMCRRCRDIGPFFWKIPQYLGSRWHNWSLNVATVTGWTKCLTEEIPVLRDTLYKQSSLDQEQCWFTWNCLVTALGNLLIFPIDMYLTYVTVSVFYFAISLESLLSSTWSQYKRNPVPEQMCQRAIKNILKRTKSFPLTVDSLQNPRILSKAFVTLIVCYSS